MPLTHPLPASGATFADLRAPLAMPTKLLFAFTRQVWVTRADLAVFSPGRGAPDPHRQSSDGERVSFQTYSNIYQTNSARLLITIKVSWLAAVGKPLLSNSER